MKESESLHARTVLIIEDQPEIARAMDRALKADFNVRLAPDTEKGFVLLTNSRIDLVLLDDSLPGDSGLEFCNIVKGDLQLRHLPIIIVSGLRDLGDRLRGLEIGSDDDFSKPFFAEELKVRVSAAIRRSQAVQDRAIEAGPSLPDTIFFTADDDELPLEFNINLN